MGDSNYVIGNIKTGIDEQKREQLYKINDKEKEECLECKVRTRCNHFCGCINRQATGFIDKVAPLQCENERLIIPIADRLAEKLYKKRSAIFIHKKYNDFYPVLSNIEDASKS